MGRIGSTSCWESEPEEIRDRPWGPVPNLFWLRFPAGGGADLSHSGNFLQGELLPWSGAFAAGRDCGKGL